MKHFASFELVGKLVQKDEPRPMRTQDNNGQSSNSMNFYVEKAGPDKNGQVTTQVFQISALYQSVQAVTNIPTGTEVFIKGYLKSSQGKNGGHFANLYVSEIARLQPKAQGYGGGYQQQQQGGYQQQQQGGYQQRPQQQYQQQPQQAYQQPAYQQPAQQQQVYQQPPQQQYQPLPQQQPLAPQYQPQNAGFVDHENFDPNNGDIPF